MQYQMVTITFFLMESPIWPTSLQLLPWCANICRLSNGTWPPTVPPPTMKIFEWSPRRIGGAIHQNEHWGGRTGLDRSVELEKRI